MFRGEETLKQVVLHPQVLQRLKPSNFRGSNARKRVGVQVNVYF